MRSPDKINRLQLLVPDWDVPAHVLACTTLRQNFESSNPLGNFNLATHVGDDQELVKKNRKILSESLALPSEPQWLAQIHSDKVVEFNQDSEYKLLNADGSITQDENVVLAVLTADCLPILITDKQGRGVAAVHAGWRGLAKGILSKSIEKLTQSLHIDPSECVVWLGPAISQQHFEVGEEVYTNFVSTNVEAEAAFILSSNEKYFCDLYALVRLELQSLGVTEISGGNHCTYAQESEYYSHRRHMHQTNNLNKSEEQSMNCGRMATLIWLSSGIRNTKKEST